MYNTTRNSAIVLMHPESAFTQYDKRHQNFPLCIRGKGNHTLWWIVYNPQVLSKAETETAFSNLYTISSKAFSIPDFTVNFVHFILRYRRNTACKQYSSIAIQRCIQETSWSKYLSQSNSNKTFSASPFTKSYSADCQSAQFTATETIFHPFYSNQCNIRSRPNSNYSLRQTTKSQSRLQSQETRQKMLFPPSLFRIQPSGVLAWELAFGEYEPDNISKTFRRKMHIQVTETCKENPYPSRFRFSRSQIRPIFRRQPDWLYYRSTTNRPDEKNSPNTRISALQKRLGSSRVHLPIKDLENPSSFCCSAPPITRTSRRNISANSFYNKRIWLQGPCNQSQTKAKTHMELSQSKSKGRRTKYQRAEEQLSINKNPDSELYSQYCLSSNAPVRIQYCQLVQTPMFTKRISIQVITNYSPGFDIDTSENDYNWTQEYTQVSCRLPIPKSVLSSFAKDQQYENLKDLSKFKNIVSSRGH